MLPSLLSSHCSCNLKLCNILKFQYNAFLFLFHDIVMRYFKVIKIERLIKKFGYGVVLNAWPPWWNLTHDLLYNLLWLFFRLQAMKATKIPQICKPRSKSTRLLKPKWLRTAMPSSFLIIQVTIYMYILKCTNKWGRDFIKYPKFR